jgi:quercetin dioxygenase-like cupin family protein
MACMTIAEVSVPDGEPISVLGATHTIRIRHTTYTVVDSMGSTGSGLPPHALDGQDKSIYVVTGEYLLALGDELRRLGPGAVAFVPRGTVHSLTVSGAEQARCVMIVSPQGAFESFLDEVRLAPRPDTDEIYAFARRAGVSLLTSPV